MWFVGTGPKSVGLLPTGDNGSVATIAWTFLNKVCSVSVEIERGEGSQV